MDRGDLELQKMGAENIDEAGKMNPPRTDLFIYEEQSGGFKGIPRKLDCTTRPPEFVIGALIHAMGGLKIKGTENEYLIFPHWVAIIENDCVLMKPLNLEDVLL